MIVTINLNDQVLVKLTQRGRDIHRKDHEDFITSASGNHAAFDPSKHPYRPPEEDKDGYTSFAWWSFMHLYGPHVYLGCEMPFDSNVKMVSRS